MHDALLDIAHRVKADTEFGTVAPQSLDLFA